MTPYTWSIIRYGFAQMILLPGYLSVGNICGRVYNNASVEHRLSRRLGWGRDRSMPPAKSCMVSTQMPSKIGMSLFCP